MTKKEALSILSYGHAFLAVSTAEEALKILDLGGLPERLIRHYEGQADANPDNSPKGLFLNEDKPIDGVNSLALSDYAVSKLGLRVEQYIGRGFQAQANAEAIGKKLKL